LLLFFSTGKCADDIVSQCLAAVGDRCFKIRPRFVDAVSDALPLFFCGGGTVRSTDDVVGPALEVRPSLRLYAKHFCINRDRKSSRKVAHEVELAFATEGRDRLCSDRTDMRRQIPNHAWHKSFIGQLAQTCVGWWITGNHPRVCSHVSNQPFYG
jgi:hypothetical protein